MTLIGVVLAAMLAASVISGYQAQYARIQQSLASALMMGEEADLRPWIGERTYADRATIPPFASRGGTSDLPPTDGTTPPASMQPVYVVSVNNATGEVRAGANSVAIDAQLLSNAIDRARASNAENGLLLDLGLSYAQLVYKDGQLTYTRIALADCSQLIATTIQQAAMAALIWALAMLVLFGISLYLARLAVRPIEQAWDKQRRFVADASHELKTPLTVILANNNLIMSHPEKSTVQQMQWLESTQQEVLLMDNLVRDLLLLARLDEGDIGAEGSASNVDISTLTEYALLQCEALFYERKVTVTSRIEPDIWVSGFVQQLARLLAILLDNASKYAVPHTQLDVRLHKQGGRRPKVLIEVSNISAPIPSAKLEQLFERFYRVDDAHSGDREGSGLGLSLAKAIVSEHRGSITVSSQPLVEGGTRRGAGSQSDAHDRPTATDGADKTQPEATTATEKTSACWALTTFRVSLPART
jgi:signal transduction histidine kinase